MHLAHGPHALSANLALLGLALIVVGIVIAFVEGLRV